MYFLDFLKFRFTKKETDETIKAFDRPINKFTVRLN